MTTNKAHASTFLPGLVLARAFFKQAVQPIISQEYSSLHYGAGLLGPGSEVLGVDDVVSTDHHWGPRVLLFLSESDLPEYRVPLGALLSQRLPSSFLGYSTNWTTPDSENSNNQFLATGSSGQINHRVEITSVSEYLLNHLGIPRLPLTETQWSLLPEQKLLEFTKGEVFHDTLGELTAARVVLAYYPDSVRALKLYALWTMIAEELAFVGRPGEVGDDVGSRLEAARLARWLVQVAFALERHYVPYPKWFGTLFAQLPIAKLLHPLLARVLQSCNWQEREGSLCEAISLLLKEHVQQGLLLPLNIKPVPFFSRAQHVVDLGPVLNALRKPIPASIKALQNSLSAAGTINEFLVHPKLLEDISTLSQIPKLFKLD